MIFCCGTLRLFDATALSFIRIRKVVNESKKYKGRPCMYRDLWSRKVADIVIAMNSTSITSANVSLSNQYGLLVDHDSLGQFT